MLFSMFGMCLFRDDEERRASGSRYLYLTRDLLETAGPFFGLHIKSLDNHELPPEPSSGFLERNRNSAIHYGERLEHSSCCEKPVG